MTKATNYHMHLFNGSYELMGDCAEVGKDDIIVRLEEWDDQQPPFAIMLEAANEIQRLRAELVFSQKWQKNYKLAYERVMGEKARGE
jgi:hypothetical protein